MAFLAFSLPAEAATGSASRGAETYEHRCEQCHGSSGEADGPAANFMLPRPRVFADNSSFKIRTTGSGELPTDDDLYAIITRGLPGSSMPPFDMLTEQERWDLVAFVKSLNADFTDPDYVSSATRLPELVSPNPPAATEATIAKGAELYQVNQCFKCHGEAGRGDGPSWDSLEDDWGDTIFPADLTNPETYRGGAGTVDIYRTISTGLNGTPMPSYADSITTDDRWSLVHYIESMHPEALEVRAESITAVKLDKLPESGDDEAWNEVAESRFKTLPNLIEPPRLFFGAVEFVTAQAAYSGDEIALRFQWSDRSASAGTDTEAVYEDRDTTIYRGTTHPDQFAVQFPAKRNDKERPFFLFGDKKKGVDLWWWRSDTGLNEMSAKGYTQLRSQPEESQQVQGEATFEDGLYTLYVRRSLTTEDATDVQFEPGVFVPIAFHAWDGDLGEVGLRHNLTTWWWLYLEPPVPSNAYVLPPIAFAVTLTLLGVLVFGTRIRQDPKNADTPIFDLLLEHEPGAVIIAGAVLASCGIMTSLFGFEVAGAGGLEYAEVISMVGFNGLPEASINGVGWLAIFLFFGGVALMVAGNRVAWKKTGGY